MENASEVTSSPLLSSPILLPSPSKPHASEQTLLLENLTQDVQSIFKCLYNANSEWNSLHSILTP